MKVVISGATGFIGRRLVDLLLERGDEPVVLTRSQKSAHRVFGDRVGVVEWTPKVPGPWQNTLDGADAVIHLAGKPVVGDRWSDEVKRELMDSRVMSTRRIVEGIESAEHRPRVFVCASAVGYYGDRRKPADESAPQGDGFLAQICAEWEAAAAPVEHFGVRWVSARIGVVLGEGGGALEKMLTSFKLFAGGHIGSGDQHMPWIHREDTCRMLLYALDNEGIQGPMNVTAPHSATMRAFSKTLGEVLQRPSWLPVPSFALKIALGEASKTVLEGQNVVPKKAQDAGFEFQFPVLKDALRDILK